MARVPHNSPEVPRMSPHPRLDSTPSESTRKGPAGCSPCSPCPYQTLLSQAACSPHCRRRRPPETRDADPPGASRWSPGRRASFWDYNASTSASGYAWKIGKKEIWVLCWVKASQNTQNQPTVKYWQNAGVQTRQGWKRWQTKVPPSLASSSSNFLITSDFFFFLATWTS